MTWLFAIFTRIPWLGAGSAIGLILALALLGVQTLQLTAARADLRAEQAARKTDVETWRAGGIQATLNAMTAARATEAAQHEITRKAGNDTQTRLDAFRRAYAGRMRPSAGADHGGPGAANLPSTADAARSVDVAADDTVISGDDARHCGEAYIVATGWQRWWTDIVAAAERR
jgi:hypothetical protein